MVAITGTKNKTDVETCNCREQQGCEIIIIKINHTNPAASLFFFIFYIFYFFREQFASLGANYFGELNLQKLHPHGGSAIFVP